MRGVVRPHVKLSHQQHSPYPGTDALERAYRCLRHDRGLRFEHCEGKLSKRRRTARQIPGYLIYSFQIYFLFRPTSIKNPTTARTASNPGDFGVSVVLLVGTSVVGFS